MKNKIITEFVLKTNGIDIKLIPTADFIDSYVMSLRLRNVLMYNIGIIEYINFANFENYRKFKCAGKKSWEELVLLLRKHNIKVISVGLPIDINFNKEYLNK